VPAAGWWTGRLKPEEKLEYYQGRQAGGPVGSGPIDIDQGDPPKQTLSYMDR